MGYALHTLPVICSGSEYKEVQERIGHSDIQMAMNVYSHVTDYLKEQTEGKFQRYIELLNVVTSGQKLYS